ncbi:hypothetical protein BD311DRAFT_807035 [Dichomitus squalens]|uniref:BTB domain-containing protein n=1 Tax=Dichomitus squalens TaxID=114155 RepID=A0A4Q9MMU7_9APHY|nr:hypothetical protein BD311DRAFT_807035 [Dichomitus squalens]
MKNSEFWYEDGTIILVVRNVEFRVYRGPLVKHSPVFHDIQSITTQPRDGRSSPSSPVLVDRDADCPVVRLSDSPEDVRHMLRIVATGRVVMPLAEPNPSFHALSAWIRLGHKYKIDKLVEDGLAYLRRFYPPYGPYNKKVLIDEDRPKSITGKFAIGVVNLARLTGSDDLIPLALLECCKLDAAITQGLVHEDGTVEYLSADDLGRCFLHFARWIRGSIYRKFDA